MNNQIFLFFYSLAHQSVWLDKIIVFLAVYFPYLVVIFAGIFLLMSRHFSRDPDLRASGHHSWKEVLSVFFVGILAWVLANILKFVFQVVRPFDALPQVNFLLTPETHYAFPSGHAAFFAALAAAIFFSHKKAGYIFMFFALFIGVARIIAGAHFPSDILGGFILGILVAYFVKNI